MKHRKTSLILLTSSLLVTAFFIYPAQKNGTMTAPVKMTADEVRKSHLDMEYIAGRFGVFKRTDQPINVPESEIVRSDLDRVTHETEVFISEYGIVFQRTHAERDFSNYEDKQKPALE